MSLTPEKIGAIETILGYVFNDKSFLVRALTRKAYALEQRSRGQYLEDQDFYCTWGDAILKLILIELLSDRGYNTPGNITLKKGQLEKRKNLGKMPIAQAIAPFLRMGHGEQIHQIHKRISVAGETFEAIVAAIYQDADLVTTKGIVSRWFADLL